MTKKRIIIVSIITVGIAVSFMVGWKVADANKRRYFEVEHTQAEKHYIEIPASQFDTSV